MWKGQIELWKGMDELTTFTLQATQAATYGKYLVRSLNFTAINEKQTLFTLPAILSLVLGLVE